MTRDEFKEKIKVLVKQVYKPDFLSAEDTVTLDAPKFPVLEKFPSLKNVIIDLLTDQYELFIVDIQWVAPRSTTFRIILGNGESFFMTYTPRSWIAKIEGKNYYLANIGEEEQATQTLARVLSYGQQAEGEAGAEAGAEAGTEAGTETATDTTTEPETPAEEPAEEEIPNPEV